MQILQDAGFFDEEPVTVNGAEVTPRDVSETVLNKLMKKIPGVSDEEVGITSMERTTAYPLSIAAMIIAHDDGGLRGVVEPKKFSMTFQIFWSDKDVKY